MTRFRPSPSVLYWLGLAVLFGLGAVVLTWPLASQIDAGIPLGTETVATVPLFNLWTLAWNVESASRGFDDYWQAPIFHPTPDAFALSEPQPLTGLVALVIQGLAGSIVTAYNLILIVSLSLNGLLAAALLRRLGLEWLPAIVGGALVLVLPFTHQELGVLQLVPLAGILAFAIAVHHFSSAPGLKAGLWMGGSLAIAYGVGGQVAVFGALAATPAALWLWWPHRGRRQAWAGLAAGVVFFLALVSPLLVAQTRATAGEGFERSVKSVRKHSARPTHYLTSPWPQLVPTPGVATAERPSARAFWPGTVRLVLALGALVMAWRFPKWRRLAIAGALVLVWSVAISLGPHLGIGEHSLADAIRAVPGLAQIRSFFRFALFAQLAVVGLTAGALQLIHDRARQRLAKPRSNALVAAVALLAIFEMRPTMGAIEALPPLDLELPWLEWVESSTQAEDVLAFVPFPEGRSSRAYLGTSQWMYWQLRHWRPMVNGYSGFFPARFRELKKIMESFPDTASLRALHDAGVQYCIVHRRVIEQSPAPDPNGPIQLVFAFQDEEHGLAIFELQD